MIIVQNDDLQGDY